MNAVDDDTIRATIQRARRLCEGESEPFRSIAFRTVLEHLLRAAPATAAATPALAASPLDMDLTEFLAAKKVTTHPDRVVAIAYFTYHTQNGAGVTTQDLTDAYSRARVKKPQNFPDVIAACVRRGRLVEGDRKDGMKAWVITRTGESYVEQTL
ncbi:MAG: hypothetical protein AB7R89_04880 [Dehalococcoidia bacterium]